MRRGKKQGFTFDSPPPSSAAAHSLLAFIHKLEEITQGLRSSARRCGRSRGPGALRLHLCSAGAGNALRKASRGRDAGRVLVETAIMVLWGAWRCLRVATMQTPQPGRF